MTRRERIETLEKRRDYLIGKRDQCKREGRPFSYFTDEIKALEWVLDLAREVVDSETA